MVRRTLRLPISIVYNFLSWLNSDSTSLLEKEKIRFRDYYSAKEDCIFFPLRKGVNEISWLEKRALKQDIQDLHEKFNQKALTKSQDRSSAMQNLQWATLVIASGILSVFFVYDNIELIHKIILVSFGCIFGMIVTKIQKHKMITARIDAYKFRLFQIYLEERYGEFLPCQIRVSRAMRGNEETPEEERDVVYEKYSISNLELISAFLIYMMYNSIIASLVYMYILPLISLEKIVPFVFT